MDDNLLEVARAIRPYLSTLVGDEAPEYDREITELLSEAASGAGVDSRIVDLLSRSSATRNWAAQVLEDELHRPPELQPVNERAFEPLPGQGRPVGAQKYVCPVDGNFVWWRRSVAIPVRECPDHQVPLVAA
jgi:hypothetical protein